MAVDKHSEAYDLSLFEPDKKKSATAKKKKNPIIIVGVSILTIIVAVVSATIVQSNVLLNELNEKIIDANETITQQNNLSAQYQLKIDSRLSGSVVQNYAEKNLGMTQATNARKKFISLSDGDYGKVIRDDGSNNVLETVANAFKGMWS